MEKAINGYKPQYVDEMGFQSCHQCVSHCHNGLHNDKQCEVPDKAASQTHLSE